MCLSVKSHLTYGASVRPENAVTYSAGNEGQKICGVFSETAPLQRSSTPSVVRPCVQSAIFPCVLCTRMCISRHAHGACVFLDTRMIYTPPRVQHFSAFHCLLCCSLSVVHVCQFIFSKKPCNTVTSPFYFFTLYNYTGLLLISTPHGRHLWRGCRVSR